MKIPSLNSNKNSENIPGKRFSFRAGKIGMFSQKNLVISFIIAMFILLAAAVVSYQTTRQFIETASRVAQTQRSVKSLDTLETNILEAETANRNYIITGDKHYLDNYQKAISSITADLESIRQLTAGNAEQRQRLDDLVPVIDEKSALMGNISNSYRSGNPAIIEALRPKGQFLRNEILQRIQEIKDEERRTLSEQSAESETLVQRYTVVSLTGAAVSFVLLLAAFYLLNRDITRSKQAAEAMRNSEARYRMLFDSNPNPVLVYDLETLRILAVNDEATRVYGYSHQEFLTMTVKDIRPPEEIPFLYKQVAAAAESREKLLHFSRHQKRDGTIIEVEVTGHPLTLEGRAVRLVLIADVTERKRAEERLRESEANLAAAQRITHLGSWEMDFTDTEDLNQNAVRWSDEVYRIFGYEPGQCEVSTEFYFSRVHPDDRERIGKTLAEAISRKTLYDIEHRVILPDGGERIVHGQAELVCDEATGKLIKMLGTVQDITERRQADAAWRESELKLRTLIESTSEGIVQVDNDEKIEFVNDSFCEMIGYSREELLGKVTLDVFFDDEGRELVLEANSERRKGVSSRYEAYLKTKSDEKLWVIICGAPIFDANGELAGTIAVFTNLTERKRAETALRESEYKLRTLIESMNEGLLQVDNDDSILFVNNCFCEMLGYTPAELTGKVWTELMLDAEGRELIKKVNKRRREGDSDRYELRLYKKTGKPIWTLVSGVPLFDADNSVSGSLGIFTDITERKRAEEQLLHDAFHDGLTGLANRALFMDHLRMTIERSKSRHSNPYAVLFLDFDRFKVINDSLGHAEGDQLLKQIARRLESATRTGDLVARLGGDEFVILLSEMLDESDAVQVAERILNNLKNPFNLNGSEIFISASIGVAPSSAGYKRAEDMLRDADIAMYRAKAKGKAQYQIFDRAMHEQASKQLKLETEIRYALERGEFRVFYQPIIELETETLVGFEALIRWQHPQRGMIPPFEFIPAAEENGLIIPLGAWILEESCRQLRQWQTENPAAANLSVSVNLSTKQFSQPDLAEQIAVILKTVGLDPQRLKLEITETHVMENSEMANVIINRLHALGVRLSLDDFGTGYSSLNYLHRLPIDYLKIDRSFVMRMTENGENREIVSTIIKLGQNLKMRVIAEGIETAAQLKHLKRLKCEFGQGYFFSKPLEASAAAEYLNYSPRSLAPMPENQPENLSLIG